MTEPTGLAERLRDDLIANSPNAVRGLPIAEALTVTARIDLVRQAKAKVDDLIAKWPWEEAEREATGPGSSPKKAKSLKEMQRRLGMALELAAKGASILDGDEEQAINLVVAWLMFHGNTKVALPDGRIVEVSGKITVH